MDGDGDGDGEGGSDIMCLLDNPNHPIWISQSYHEPMASFDHQEEQQQQIVQQQLMQQQHGLKRGLEEDSLLLGNNVDDDLEMMGNPFMEKKRRLTPEQVDYLEKTFEKDSKLEADKKAELAKELGLEARQVSVWFQNRRARYKNKQLERDYSILKSRYDQLKADFDFIKKEKHGLQIENELMTMKVRQMEFGLSQLGSDGLVNAIRSQTYSKVRPKLEPKRSPKVPSRMTKQTEDEISGKSDVVDSESPHSVEVNRYLHPEGPVGLANVVDSDYVSEDNKEMMNTLPPTFQNSSKVEQKSYYWAWFK